MEESKEKINSEKAKVLEDSEKDLVEATHAPNKENGREKKNKL